MLSVGVAVVEADEQIYPALHTVPIEDGIIAVADETVVGLKIPRLLK